MNEQQLIRHWASLRNQLIFSQLAPTFLLITIVGLMPELSSADMYVRWASLGILLASGILGAVVQFSASHEAQAVARDLAESEKPTHTARSIVSLAPWLHIAKFVTPTIFVGIFIALALTLI